MKSFKIIPILGRKTDVMADDESMFKFIAENVAMTHDAGGMNFDITEKANACSKSKGYVQWANSPCYQSLGFDGETGTFSTDDALVGATSGATATVVSNTSNVLVLKDVSGTFQDDEIIYVASYGSELLTDGDCSSDSFNDDTSGVAYDAGSEEYDWDGTGADVSIYQSSPLTIGSFYKLVFTVKNYASGRVKIYAGSGSYGTERTSDATYTEHLQCLGSSVLYVQGTPYASTNFEGSVDDVSAKQITNAALVNGAPYGGSKCLGLYELVSGTTRDHIYADNGKIFIFDSSLDPVMTEDATPTTFASDNTDLYSFITVGAYMVFADRAEHTPYKWKHGDANLSKLIASGTEYKFRNLVSFQRRVIGLYSDQTDGDIDIRWSTSWPGTAIADLNFPAANQLYVPNDDSITGGATMGHDRCYIYCENSIHQLVYYADYSAPFRCYTTVQKQGAENHHSIVNMGDRHYLFNRNYGFCEYRGGSTFPYGGLSLSDPIEDLIQGMNADYYNLIVGTFIPLTKEVCWTVPLENSSTPTHLLFYNIETGQWRVEDKSMRYVDEWRLVDNFTWNDLITAAGGVGSDWSGVSSNSWAYYGSHKQRLVYANTDGLLYNRDGDDIAGTNLDGYRIEPAMHFGSVFEQKNLLEIWFGIALSGAYSIDVYHRSGNTMGELVNASWTSLGSVSCDDNSRPVLPCSKTARYHQIKWGTDLKDERFRVSDIIFKYEMGSDA